MRAGKDTAYTGEVLIREKRQTRKNQHERDRKSLRASHPDRVTQNVAFTAVSVRGVRFGTEKVGTMIDRLPIKYIHTQHNPT